MTVYRVTNTATIISAELGAPVVSNQVVNEWPSLGWHVRSRLYLPLVMRQFATLQNFCSCFTRGSLYESGTSKSHPERSTELTPKACRRTTFAGFEQKPLEITLRQAQDDFKLVASRNVWGSECVNKRIAVTIQTTVTQSYTETFTEKHREIYVYFSARRLQASGP
jgi:hypothetical protein